MLFVDAAPVEEWLRALKPYQKVHLEALLKSGRSPEEAAELWLSARGAESTIGFGGTSDSKPFLDRFKAEFKQFVCGGQGYEQERSQLIGKMDAVKTAIISGVSSAIAVHVGTSATLLIPAVALMLHVVGKIGIRAWCAENDTLSESDGGSSA
jgi:hypothetical protein